MGFLKDIRNLQKQAEAMTPPAPKPAPAPSGDAAASPDTERAPSSPPR